MNGLEPVNIHVPESLELSSDINWDFEAIAKIGPFRTTLHGDPAPGHFQRVINDKLHQAYTTHGIRLPRGEVKGRTYDVQRSETWPDKNVSKTKPVFQQFSEINGDPKKILEFAQSFGLLGFHYPLKSTALEDLEEAEPIFFWIVWSKIMFRCLVLWEGISSTKTRDIDMQKEVLSASCDIVLDNETKRVTCKFHTTPGSSLTSGSQDKAYQSSNVTNAALKCLLGQINPHLETGITYHALLDPETLTILPRLRSKSLFTYLWYDFANHVCSGREIRTCPACRNFFVSNASEKTRRKTCSDKCRAKKMRAKTKGPNP